jgi:hypothetical protein
MNLSSSFLKSWQKIRNREGQRLVSKRGGMCDGDLLTHHRGFRVGGFFFSKGDEFRNTSDTSTAAVFLVIESEAICEFLGTGDRCLS